MSNFANIFPDRRTHDWRFRRVDPAQPNQLLRMSDEDRARARADSYGVQCVLLAQWNFKLDRNSDEWGVDAYSDRLPHSEFSAIVQRYTGTGPMILCSWTQSASLEQIKDFVADICRMEWCGRRENLTGFRIMRHTNVSSGHPLHTFEAVGKKVIHGV